MCRVSVRVAAALLVAFSGICAVAARAQPVGDIAHEQRDENSVSLTGGRPDSLLFFSGFDLWRNGAFAHDGLLWAPQGLDHQGFLLKLMIGGGLYRYYSGALSRNVIGREFSASILPGWRFKRGRFTATVFAGLDVQYHRLSPDDPSSTLRGTAAGLRGGVELWYEPTADTMVSADASATSIGPSYSARAAFGWRIFDRFYLGPEIQAFAFDNDYRQFRVGAHATALKTGPVEWSAGMGWARDSDDRDGLYGRLGMILR